MGIYKYSFYNSPNIGIFVKCNDSLIILPFGFAPTKTKKLMNYLELSNKVNTSIGGTRLIGPMIAINNNGILVPSTTSDEEIDVLKQASGINVEKLNSKYTAIGNLIAVNDHGAIVSPILKDVSKQIQNALDIPIHVMTISGFIQTGTIIVPSNSGAIVHPNATDEEIKTISDVLHVDVEPATINGGIPFLSSGIIVNSKSLIVGNLTSGPELIMLSRAFKM